ncbi:outer membrane autotransporter [Venturia nashicola]|nr:outer membrane autotransporter [Venturia nashicola]
MILAFVRIAATAFAFSSLSFAAPTFTSSAAPVAQTDCNGQYTYKELAGYGFLRGDSRDKFGDTNGGIGSSAAIDKRSWVFDKLRGRYTGLLYALPDRGWNTEGTINYVPRVQKFLVTFTPKPNATVANPASPNINLTYLDTILLRGPDGTPTTGLDADATTAAKFPGFPDLPVATYTGDGFGGAGKGGKAISIDAEGLVLSNDGGFWISDEYGPYIYRFNAAGLMIGAIGPPDAILPVRNGTVSFSANSAPRYDLNKTIIPANPTTGRQNNQGFEGLTVDEDGQNLYVLLQSATQEDGGDKAATRRNTRFLKYDISEFTPSYVSEYVVQLPTFTNAAGAARVAAQSEVHYISDTQFLVLARDSGAGHAAESSTSIYRHIDVFDISKATNVKGPSRDSFNGSIASRGKQFPKAKHVRLLLIFSPTAGVLNADITPARYCSFIDFNINSQLNRFGVHNGGAQDAGLLNEKWESMVLLPAEADDEYYLFALSDDDFITQNGYINYGKVQYKDASGYSLDNQVLVFKVSLPKGSNPLVG